MSWLRQLPQRQRRGSRPRCVLMVESSREEVASPSDATRGPSRCGGVSRRQVDTLWQALQEGRRQMGQRNLQMKHNSVIRKNRTTSCNLRFTGNSTDWWLAVQRGRMTHAELGHCQYLYRSGRAGAAPSGSQSTCRRIGPQRQTAR